MSREKLANDFNVTTIRLLVEIESIAKSNKTIADEIYTQRRRFATLIGSTPLLPIGEAYTHILEYAEHVLDGQEQFEQYILSFDPKSVGGADYPLMDEMMTAVSTMYPVCPLVKRERLYTLVLDLIKFSAEWAKLD